MRPISQITLLICCMTLMLCGCTDHRLRPLSPLRVRLKTVSNPTTTIKFNYNAKSQLDSFNISGNIVGYLAYDSLGRYKRLDYYTSTNHIVGEVTFFSYPANGNPNFAGSNQSINGQSNIPNQSFYYTLDAQGRLIMTTSGLPTASVFDNVTYQYSGDNIVRATSSTGAVAPISHPTLTYEYDDKPNPYFGLLFPDENPYYATRNHPLPEVVRQYSRNNITKITTVDNTTTSTVNLIYQYDSRGLPISVTTSGGTAGTKVGGYVVVGQVTLITYESF